MTSGNSLALFLRHQTSFCYSVFRIPIYFLSQLLEYHIMMLDVWRWYFLSDEIILARGNIRLAMHPLSLISTIARRSVDFFAVQGMPKEGLSENTCVHTDLNIPWVHMSKKSFLLCIS